MLFKRAITDRCNRTFQVAEEAVITTIVMEVLGMDTGNGMEAPMSASYMRRSNCSILQ